MTRLALFLAGLASASLAGCGGGMPSYGAPTTPTGTQMQAATQLNTSVDQILTLRTKAENAQGLYGMMSSIGPTAVRTDAKRDQALRLAPEAFPPGCVTGAGTGTITYKDCTDSNTTMNGTVTATETSLAVDLTIKTSGSGANVDITLKGMLMFTATTLKGELVYEYKINLGGLGGLPGAGAGNQKTTVTYDITYGGMPTCVQSGSIAVVQEGALSGGAKFTWTGCNMYQVANST